MYREERELSVKAGPVHDHQPGARGRHGNGKTAGWFPPAIEIDSFFPRRTEMLRFKVPETPKIVHMSLRELAERFSTVRWSVLSEMRGLHTGWKFWWIQAKRQPFHHTRMQRAY